MQLQPFDLSAIPQHSATLIIAPREGGKTWLINKLLSDTERYANPIRFDRYDSPDRSNTLHDFLKSNSASSKTVVLDDMSNRTILRDTGILFRPSKYLCNVIVSIFDVALLYATETKHFDTIFVRTVEPSQLREILNTFAFGFKDIDESSLLAYLESHDRGFIVIRPMQPNQRLISVYDAESATPSSYMTTLWRWITWQ